MTFVTPLLYMLVSTNVNEKGLIALFGGFCYEVFPTLDGSSSHQELLIICNYKFCLIYGHRLPSRRLYYLTQSILCMAHQKNSIKEQVSP